VGNRGDPYCALAHSCRRLGRRAHRSGGVGRLCNGPPSPTSRSKGSPDLQCRRPMRRRDNTRQLPRHPPWP
jgi:hypothetical protein